MLEDKKYANLLTKLKSLPNPSDDKYEEDSDDDDRRGSSGDDKPKYTKFDPTDPQWDSDSEDNAGDSNPITGARSVDDGSGVKSKQKKTITKKEAIDLFTQLLLEERNKQMNAVKGESAGEAQSTNFPRSTTDKSEKNLESDKDDNNDETDSGYMNAWKEYYYNIDRVPGDRPRPSRQVGPA